ncbi:Piso0_002125 [Millerozyma farinosa CBS 7064]|uniref:Piso0_002125 protein n=1 Tax=Pichia sorbitophila (strain ATCC MYA-4447 / BCRC 22081 / CBS 7064 / NBRC 10061 / NRRL Y-12695) TaxID=559304 RepID=G8YE69_PICSO|nr:Piso0_002125 [Millerozyma farinosa CBS 7064]
MSAQKQGSAKNVKGLTINTDEGAAVVEAPKEGVKDQSSMGEGIESKEKVNDDGGELQGATRTAGNASASDLPESEFKTPKKKPMGDSRRPESTQTGSTRPVGTENATATRSIPSAKLNKATISNLNKSLKAKQRIINARSPQPKSPIIITEMLNTSPQAATFANGYSASAEHEADNTNSAAAPAARKNSSSNTLPTVPNPSSEGPPKQAAIPTKRISKQNSTRTDFFAAKLASAVDDVDSSDSDETFVYENNFGEEGAKATQKPANPISAPIDNASVSGSASVTPAGVPSQSPRIPNEESHEAGTTRGNEPGRLLPPRQSTPGQGHNTGTSEEANKAVEPSETSSTHASLNMDNMGPARQRPPYNRNGSVYSVAHSSHQPEFNKPLPFNEPTASSKASNTSNFQSPRQQSPREFNHNNGAGDIRPFNSTQSNRGTSINEGSTFAEEQLSYDDVASDVLDNASINTETYSVHKGSGGSTHNYQNNYGNISLNNDLRNFSVPLNTSSKSQNVSAASNPSKNYKSSTSSSKLRSTTSKLFDKKGSQPRRYSIIPDDIDIEDFDDELIYYDNSVRFPYNDGNITNYNETSPLLGQHPRIPHHRSLNLNMQGNKKNLNLKNKRYLSTGQAFLDNGNENKLMPNNKYHNPDIFPFPYSDPQQNYYYDVDELEDSISFDDGNRKDAKFYSPRSGQFSNQYFNPHLQQNKNRFVLSNVTRSNVGGKRMNCIKSFLCTLISVLSILLIGFLMGFIFTTTKNLTNVSIQSIESATVSQDELLFNIVVEAFNPGWFTVAVSDVELDIFAKSGYLGDHDDDDDDDVPEIAVVETVLLGTVRQLESELLFDGGFFTRERDVQKAGVKLVSPGRNLTEVSVTKDKPDNSKKWEIISKHPFDLVVRGVMKYTLPFGRSTQSVSVNKVGYIDPTQDTLI